MNEIPTAAPASAGWRVIVTILAIIGWQTAKAIWGAVESPILGAAAAQQANDSVQGGVVTRAMSSSLISNVVGLSLLAIVVAIWWSFFASRTKYQRSFNGK